MRSALIVIGCVLGCAAPVAQATGVKRIATAKKEAVANVRQRLGIGQNGGHATSIHCRASKLLRSHKSKTWKCSFHYRGARLADSAPLACRARYRVGLEDRGNGPVWNNRKLGSKVCRPA